MARRIAYTLQLTPAEVNAIIFARGRYSWPDALFKNLDPETNKVEMTEADAWDWLDDVASDEEGGHSPFPLAASAFADKLWSFRDRIV